MSKPLASLLALAVGMSCVTATASARNNAVRWFHSPSGNIQCEVASMDVRGSYVYCQALAPLQTATLHTNGNAAICSHRACSVGDAPEGASTLAYGHSIRIGVFRCASSIAGVRCAVAATGHGFMIARSGILTF